MRQRKRERLDTLRRQEQEYRESLYEPTDRLQTSNVLSVPSIERSNALVPVRDIRPNSLSKPLVRSNLPLVVLAYSLGIVGIAINGWFAWTRGSTAIDKTLLLSLGFISEAIAFYLPTQTANLWRQYRYGGFVFSSVVYVCLFVFALINSLGFASTNLTEATTARSERISSAVSDAQRRLDTLSTSRKDECLKRGDRCRQLEKDEQQAMEALRDAREKVAVSSDPQILSASKLVSWLSVGRYNPTSDDFAMLRLFLLTLLPQLGGVVLMVAKKG
jgi:hypothetical protein